jgi:hypothetical protein
MARKADAQQLELEVERLETPTRRLHDKHSSREEHANRRRPAAAELLAMPGALLTRTHLRRLGLERRAVDAIFRALPVVALPGYSRPMVRVEDYVQLIEHNTYRDDRVRPV